MKLRVKIIILNQGSAHFSAAPQAALNAAKEA